MRIPRLRHLLRQWYIWLFLITGIAIGLRSLPAWQNPAWGCDFGIYYQLTNTFVQTKELINPYFGWGGSYQYFPVLYAVTGIAHWITGLDVLTLLPKIAPIFGGLSVLIFYFIVNELIHDRKKSLLATAFLAVLPFHVYQTSHAAPLTMGHFFLMLSLYLFLRFRKKTIYAVPLLASTMLLIMSHHLTTYFYLISLIAIVFLENAGSWTWTRTIKKDVLYILLASGLVFTYWIVVAKTVFQSFMGSGLRIGSFVLPSYAALILFYVLFFSLFGIVWLKRRFGLFFKSSEPTTKSCIIKFFTALIVCIVPLCIFTVVTLPWTNFKFTPLSLFYSIPLLLMIGFGVAGFRFTRFLENGNFIRGWLLAPLLSFLYALVTNNTILPPDRHLEYMMAPLSIFVVFGVRGIFLGIKTESFSLWKQKMTRKVLPRFQILHAVQKRQVLYIIVIVFLVTTNAVSVYPSQIALNASYEVISNEDLAAIDWINHNLDRNTSVIASDHRLARMAEAVGFNTTLDQASVIWTAENFSDYFDELDGVQKNYTHITHIVIDDIMKEQMVHVYFGDIMYMTNQSYNKFLSPPFELVYRNTTETQGMAGSHWVEVYRVNWTFIDGLGSRLLIHRLRS